MIQHDKEYFESMPMDVLIEYAMTLEAVQDNMVNQFSTIATVLTEGNAEVLTIIRGAGIKDRRRS